MKNLYITLVLAIVGTASLLYAESPSFFVAEEVVLDFNPADALFVGKTNEKELISTTAAFIKPPTKPTWVFGAKINSSDLKTIVTFLLVRGSKGEVKLFGPRLIDAGNAMPELGTVDSLREKVLQRKAVLKSFELQSKAQEESLNRLRDEADRIGELGRIVEVKDEIERTKASIKDIERDMESLQVSVRVARSQPQPHGMVTRETQLTKQVALLAVAAREAEAGERERRALSQQDQDQRFQLIEETREDNLDTLQRELVSLRRERLNLERRAEAHAPETQEDYLQ